MLQKTTPLKILLLSVSLSIAALAIVLFSVKKSFPQTPPKREMRGVWIATVLNLDWPSSRHLSPEKQKKELSNMLDFQQKNGMNAVFFQVRPATDAFYESRFEPWSYWLTGEQGKAPEPFYDPLKFAVQECHQRNMELHAWFNPFRVVSDTSQLGKLDSTHIALTKPEWTLTYGKGVYLDPGIPEVRKYIVKIIRDVVTRYDIDGVHFDDYFYPYKIWGVEFPDTLSFERYSGDFLPEDIDDWRRNNVDLIIKDLNESIKEIKPYVKFGIAPFGVWRNKRDDPLGSETRGGAPCYDALYADVRKWLEKGWIDYVAPQLYWEIGHKAADFEILIDWWSKNSFGKHLYIGHGAYKIDPNSKVKAWQKPDQMPMQIAKTRQYNNVHGSIFFRAKTFNTNPNGINEKFRNEIYSKPALVPTMDWIDNQPPRTPGKIKAKKQDEGSLLQWDADPTRAEMDKTAYYVIYRFRGKKPGDLNKAENIYKIVRQPSAEVKAKKSFFAFFRKRYTFVVTAVDRMHNESPPSKSITLKLKR